MQVPGDAVTEAGKRPNEFEHRRWNDERWTASWPQREALTTTVTPQLMAAADLRPGERVLDVGTGGGGSAIEAARRVSPGGEVLGVDISEALLSLAGERAVRAAVGNVAFVVADAQAERLPSSSFDAAMSQFGVMFFDRPTVAFANIASHLRPGGRLVFACWQAADRNPWHTARVLRSFVPPPPEPAAGESVPGAFSLGDPDRVEAILQAAGFEGIEREDVEAAVRAPAGAVYDPAQLEFHGVPAEQTAEADAAVQEHLRRFEIGAGEYEFPLAYAIWTASSP